MKYLQSLGVFAAALFLFNMAGISAPQEFSVSDRNVQAIENFAINADDEPADQDKLEVVRLLIESAKVNNRDVCFEKQPIFVSTGELPEYVLTNFPQKIRDCQTVLVKESEIKSDFRSDLHDFSRWSLNKGLIRVTFSTKFPGGNEGGGNFVLHKIKGKWAVKESDWWATAS